MAEGTAQEQQVGRWRIFSSPAAPTGSMGLVTVPFATIDPATGMLVPGQATLFKATCQADEQEALVFTLIAGRASTTVSGAGSYGQYGYSGPAQWGPPNYPGANPAATLPYPPTPLKPPVGTVSKLLGPTFPQAAPPAIQYSALQGWQPQLPSPASIVNFASDFPGIQPQKANQKLALPLLGLYVEIQYVQWSGQRQVVEVDVGRGRSFQIYGTEVICKAMYDGQYNPSANVNWQPNLAAFLAAGMATHAKSTRTKPMFYNGTIIGPSGTSLPATDSTDLQDIPPSADEVTVQVPSTSSLTVGVQFYDVNLEPISGYAVTNTAPNTIKIPDDAMWLAVENPSGSAIGGGGGGLRCVYGIAL